MAVELPTRDFGSIVRWPYQINHRKRFAIIKQQRRRIQYIGKTHAFCKGTAFFFFVITVIFMVFS